MLITLLISMLCIWFLFKLNLIYKQLMACQEISFYVSMSFIMDKDQDARTNYFIELDDFHFNIKKLFYNKTSSHELFPLTYQFLRKEGFRFYV